MTSTHDLNPWNDKPPTPPPHDHLRTPDPALLDHSIAPNVFGHPDGINLEQSHPANEVLSEFDPLASPEEQAARAAWQTAEGHPPPSPATHPSTEDAPSNATSPITILPPSRSLSPFPSLASLAKTFSLPNLTRSRPSSMDATPPSNLSTVITAQSENASEEPDGGNDEPHPPLPPPSPSESEPEVEIQFDFQKFLDQMKSRSAEPVSKYLRS